MLLNFFKFQDVLALKAVLAAINNFSITKFYNKEDTKKLYDILWKIISSTDLTRYYKNKNDYIHKVKLKKSYNNTIIGKFRVPANITEYQIISKLIF